MFVSYHTFFVVPCSAEQELLGVESDNCGSMSLPREANG